MYDVFLPKVEDLVFVSSIHSLIKREASGGKMTSHSTEEIRLAILKGNSCIAKTEGGRLIGYASVICWHNYVELAGVVVDVDFRGNGIGNELFSRMIDLSKSKFPDKELIILTNNISQRIAEKFGFIEKPKEEFNGEIWSLCKECVEYSNFPRCHCRAMILGR